MRCIRRVDDKGMTLVELLIAVTILAIIVVPLLHAFISSARINRKSKESQRLTIMGQDIMEGLKAYSVEDLAYEFDYPGGCSKHGEFQLIKPNLIGNGMVSSNVAELVLKAGATDKFEQCSKGPSGNQSIKEITVGAVTDYEFNVTPGKKFYYMITNVSSEISSGNSFTADVFISVDPVKYTSSGGISGNAAHNDYVLSDIESMDTTRDAFFVEPGSQVKSAYEELKSDGAAITSPAQMSREIIVKVEDALPLYKQVTYEFKYTADGKTVTYPKSSISTAKYENLENVYLFYIPSYSESGHTYNGDTILYSNSTDSDVVFNLIKRMIVPEDGLGYEYATYSSLQPKESGYKCNVYVKDSSTGHTELRTNVDTDISVLVQSKTAGYDADKILGQNNKRNSNVKFYLGDQLSFVEDPDIRNSVEGKDKYDRIFDVTIDIYEAGSLAAALMPGGTGELPVDKHLVTVKGNMN